MTTTTNIAAVYDYTDPFGDLIYQVVRLEPKNFRQRRPDGNGGWLWNLDGTPRVPYRLPEILGSAPEKIFISEGEKDVESLRALGLVATTNSGGCGAGWPEELTPHFAGRDVVVLADNDGPGLEHADVVAGALHVVAKSVRLVWLPDLPPKGDVSDWLAAGHTREELEQIVRDWPLWESPAPDVEIVNPRPARVPKDAWPAAMSEDAFIGLAGDFVRLMEPHTESDRAALLTNFIVASGVLFGREAWAFADGKRHYPVESLLIAGASGGARKGTATERVLPVMYEAEPGLYDRVLGGLSTGEGLIKAVSKKLGETPETVGRYLVYLPEFASLLIVMKRDGNTMSTVIRQAWDCKRLEVRTKKDPLDVDNVNISLIGHVTPTELLNSLTATERANGFANRLLIQYVRRSKFLPEGGGEVDTCHISRRLRAAVDASSGRGRVQRDGAARAIWADVYPSLARVRDGIAGALCARAETHTLRLSLLYALLDCSDAIRPEHLNAALAVWNYCERSVDSIFGRATGDADGDRILTALISGPMTMTELQRLFSNNRGSDWIHAKMAALVRSGEVVTTTKEGDKKTMGAWKLKES